LEFCGKGNVTIFLENKGQSVNYFRNRSIVRWVIEGIRLFKKEGLALQPQSIQDSLIKVERDNDKLGAFIRDYLKKYDPSLQYVEQRKNLNEIYEVYRYFEAEEYGSMEEQIISQKTFFKVMRDRNMELSRIHKSFGDRSYYLIGWCLKAEKVYSIPQVKPTEPPPPEVAGSPPTILRES
jgi:hypothetical protein